MSFSFWSRLSAFSLFLILCLAAGPNLATAHPLREPCQALLDPQTMQTTLRLQLTEDFGSFEKPAFTETQMAWTRKVPTPLTRIVDLPDGSNFEIPRQETWSLNGQTFRFMDVGFKNMERSSYNLHALMADHLQYHKDINLVVRLSEWRTRTEEILKKYRWHLHDAVVAKYKLTKRYLNTRDNFFLRRTNLWSTNSDVFGVFSKNDRGYEVGATIQVSYFGDRNYFYPSLGGVLAQRHLKVSQGPKDRLPFEYRLDPYEGIEFVDQLYQQVNPETSCELTRYASFHRLPRAIQDRMLHEALTAIAKRGMATVLISVDEVTERLFRRYGFKRYGEMPVTQTERKEYLMYMFVHSKEFDEFYRQVARSASPVVVQRGVVRE